ncbi:hypothetical protein BDW42DRAFT_159606 [Aspergillus taichungensis]|uniref:Uncharacterized protein n=1 Tax=Aspergillus taichungensis TaxID=482145 RepID=A0A2J5I7C3_9EURO|nr:hypothetical protein BDW42DRAFT_159606 [Aspergillus taichungensis]
MKRDSLSDLSTIEFGNRVQVGISLQKRNSLWRWWEQMQAAAYTFPADIPLFLRTGTISIRPLPPPLLAKRGFTPT